MRSEDEIKTLLNTGKWAYTIIDNEIHFKYLGNKDKTDLGYILHFDWPESKEQPMSEIEKIKMMQNAGIEPTYTDECIIANRYWDNEELANEYGTFDKFMEKNCKFGYQDCADECEYAYTKTHYPPFTAEKQLELIKFLIKNYEGIDISKRINRFNFLVDNATFIGCHHNDKSFEESLAGVINKLWADMSEEEKQQVKGILE